MNLLQEFLNRKMMKFLDLIFIRGRKSILILIILVVYTGICHAQTPSTVSPGKTADFAEKLQVIIAKNDLKDLSLIEKTLSTDLAGPDRSVIKINGTTQTKFFYHQTHPVESFSQLDYSVYIDGDVSDFDMKAAKEIVVWIAPPPVISPGNVCISLNALDEALGGVHPHQLETRMDHPWLEKWYGYPPVTLNGQLLGVWFIYSLPDNCIDRIHLTQDYTP